MTTEQRKACWPSSAEMCREPPAVRLDPGCSDRNPVGKESSRQSWRARVGRVLTAPTLAWAGRASPGWSECLWPFVRICGFFMRWGVSSQMEEAIWNSEPFRLF